VESHIFTKANPWNLIVSHYNSAYNSISLRPLLSNSGMCTNVGRQRNLGIIFQQLKFRNNCSIKIVLNMPKCRENMYKVHTKILIHCSNMYADSLSSNRIKLQQ